MKCLATALVAASLLKFASAHGYVDNATIGGTFYQVCTLYILCITSRQLGKHVLIIPKFYQV